MTPAENKKLDTIIAKLERLQNTTSDEVAKSRLLFAKDELLRLWNEESRRSRRCG